MGGRGASSGKTYEFDGKWLNYGDEFKTLFCIDNIKFIIKKEGSTTAPIETLSFLQNRIYVTINDRNQIKTITFYDNVGKRNREIHLKPHGKLGKHVHIGYDPDHKKEKPIELTDKEDALVKRIEMYWEEYKK